MPHWLAAPLRAPARSLLWAPPMVVILLSAATPGLPGLLGGFVLMLVTIGLWIGLLTMASRVLVGQLEDRQGRAVDLLSVPQGVGLRQVGLWLLVTLFLLAAAATATWLLAVFALIVLLVVPAATLHLSRDGRLAEALYPPAWWALAGELGRADYLRLSLVLGLSAAMTAALAGLTQPLPVPLRNAAGMALWSYATLAWFALAGQTLARHRHSAKAAEGPAEAMALEALWHEAMNRGAGLTNQRRLAAALALAGDHERELKHGGRFLAALLEGFERPAEAVELSARLLALDPDFALERPSQMLVLIQAAEAHGPPALTLRLCRNFLGAFPAAPKRAAVREIIDRVIRRQSGRTGGPTAKA